MSDEIETIDKNPKSWAAWKREAERLQAIIDDMVLAAMDSEPVAYMTYKGYLLHAGDPKLAEYSEPMPLYADSRPEPISAEPVAWLLSGGGAKNVVVFDSGNAYADPLREVTPLYRHAQPAPVVPELRVDWQENEFSAGWNACRAAMLQAGNSPVIPDGWTGNDKANAALMMLDRIETVDPVDDDRIDGIKRIVRELAAAPHDTPALNSVQSVDSVADRWIPVSERIPDNTEPVLCIEKRADFGTYGQPFVCWHDGGGWVGKTNYRPIVTHWMPLPAAPQEVR